MGYRDVSVNDVFRPVSRFFDRVERPEQLPDALLGAMRALSDPAETGAATVCLDQDVQAEAFDWPEQLFAPRVWHVDRPIADPAALARARHTAQRPPTAHRGWRRRDLLRGDRGAQDLRGSNGGARRRNPGGQGISFLRSPAGSRSDRRDGHDGRQRPGPVR